MSKRTPLALRYKEDTVVEVGLDEAGRGSFWGPFMAGAVVWPPVEAWTADHKAIAGEIRDSKKIAPKKRERLADDIKRLATSWHIGSVSNKEIDEHGITWANQEAFRRAVGGLKAIEGRPKRLLIDGELSIVDYADEQHTIVEGDNTYLVIGAASILAKVEHDRWVQAYCDGDAVCAERYGLRTSKGYGTQAHRDGLVAYGAHELHRRTFIGRYVGTEQALPKPVATNAGYRKVPIDSDKCLIRL